MKIAFLENNSILDRLEEGFDVHLCKPNEVLKLMSFIDSYWKKDHIMAKSLEMMNWQHYDREKDLYTFMIAVEKSTQEIAGVFGYIPARLQRDAQSYMAVSGAIWKVKEELNATGLGLLLLKKIICNPETDIWITNGLNLKTDHIYRKLKFTMVDLQQWFILNQEINNFRIADAVQEIHRRPMYLFAGGSQLTPCDENEFRQFFEEKQKTFPLQKTLDYYIMRFFCHPIYEYTAYGIREDGELVAVLFTRISYANNAKALRIIDYVGKYAAIISCYTLFQTLLKDLNAEYVDFMEWGFPTNYLRDGGFLLRQDSDIVIPNFFEPFVRENRDVHSAYLASSDPQDLVIFKGDGDQDRPSFLPEKAVL